LLRTGRVEETGDPLLPYRLIGSDGVEVDAVTEFLHHMLADDDSPTSLRSYAYELLTWFRFLAAVDVAWDHAGRAEASDFALWLKTVKKPPRQRRPDAPRPGAANPVTGKQPPGENYADRTRRHARAEYQPREPRRIPRSIPDQAFNELFAGLASHRDSALVAFYISTGARPLSCSDRPGAWPLRKTSSSAWSARAAGRFSTCRPRRTRSSAETEALLPLIGHPHRVGLSG
jgi:hypothetical protein